MKLGKNEIVRAGGNGRCSTCVLYGGVLYIGSIATVDLTADMRVQAMDVFSQLDRLMAQNGTDKTRILCADVVVQNLAELGDFNQAWDEWITDGHEPVRKVTIADLKLPEYKVSICLQVAANN